jgi:hypothetical protein
MRMKVESTSNQETDRNHLLEQVEKNTADVAFCSNIISARCDKRGRMQVERGHRHN